MRFSDAMKPAPTKESDGREIWNTSRVESTLHAIQEGYQVKNPFYEGNPNWRKGNIVFEYTPLEIEEIRKCARDIVYFANTYCQVMTDEGYQRIVLRDYQVETLRTYQRDRFILFLSARQTGKTITTGIFLTWYLLFHFDRNVMLMSNKGDTSKEIMSKIKAIMEGLPFFLKPGVIKNDVMSMVFDNKCTITAGTTTARSGIGFTIHLLFLDEFAHVPRNVKVPFYENIVPTVSSSKVSKVIITSTPNGYDLFHDLYHGAIAEPKRNPYTAIKVDWWNVPGRDDNWKKEQLTLLGSEEAFNVQYGCSFSQGDQLLLGSSELNRLKNQCRPYVVREFEELDSLRLDYTALRWDPDFDESLMRSSSAQFVITVDLSEGVGRDYSVVNIFMAQPLPSEDMRAIKSPGSSAEFFGLRQVGVFRHNKFSVQDVAKIVYTLMVKVFNPDNVKLVVEANIYGNEIVKDLLSVYPASNNFDEGTVVKYFHRAEATSRKFGFRFNTDSKKVYCEKTRRLINSGRLYVTHDKTAEEFQYFARRTNGTYAAQAGNDDLAMSVVLASTFFDTVDYSEMMSEVMDTVSPEDGDYIERTVDSVDSRGDDATGLDEFGFSGPDLGDPVDPMDPEFLGMF